MQCKFPWLSPPFIVNRLIDHKNNCENASSSLHSSLGLLVCVCVSLPLLSSPSPSACHSVTHSYARTQTHMLPPLFLALIPSTTVALSNLLLSFSVSNNSGPLLWQQSSVQKQANIALATNHNLFAVRNLLSCLVKLIFSTVSFMMAVAEITKPYHGGRRLRSYRCYCDIILVWWWPVV